jgi:hypothetical protein
MTTTRWDAEPFRSPLRRAQSQERVATYAIFTIALAVLLVVGRAVVGVGGESVQDHERLIGAIATFAQVVVALTTLFLVRNQLKVAVHQMEQAELSGAALRDLARGVASLRADLTR